MKILGSENSQNENLEQNSSKVDEQTVILNYSTDDLKSKINQTEEQKKDDSQMENLKAEANQTNEQKKDDNQMENLKAETKQTVNQVKETIKNTDLKKDAKAAKGFFSSFFQNPLKEIEKCASDNKSSFLKVAIVLLLIWIVAIFIGKVASLASIYLFGTYGSFSSFFRHIFSNLFDIFKALIAPIISLAVLSGLSYGFSKSKSKSFINTVSTIVISHIPAIIANIVNLLVIFGSRILKITNCFSSFCSILSTVLLYFAVKYLSGESEDKYYFWKFALIMGIFYIIKFVFSYLEIYL